MNFFIKSLLFIFSISLLVTACKKEDDVINDNVDPNGGSGNIEFIIGCMVDTACNYNVSANQDNESCNYDCYGCVDKTAYNYSTEATIDDGSCSYASQILLNTWNVNADCDGFILGNVVPDEITLQEGSNEGEIIADFGFFTLTGTVSQDGDITIPSQDVSFGEFSAVSVFGSGDIENEQTVELTITASVLLLFSETCELTFTL
ncbi:MAG: hypothetical protein ACON4E_02815 [Flavobacteriales bacterium]